MRILTSDQAVLDHVAARREAIIGRTIDWANINSGSRNAVGLNAVMDALETTAKALPATVERIPTHGSTSVADDGSVRTEAHAAALKISARPSAPIQVVLTGHYDTVFPADSRFQTVTTRADGALNGPGVADMKGGISVMLAALEAFETHPNRHGVGWTVLLSPDEEIGSPASAPLLAELGARGHVGLTYEPALADGTLAGARKGSGNYHLIVAGRAAHAGRAFDEGRNAVAGAAILAAALPCAWADMPKKHRDTPQFAIVGYGKLGGKELGYASDLDLVYLYDDPHPDAGDVYSRLARRLTNWLSAATGAGSLYETDLRLRPNGDAGFLAHSIAAFEKYQHENAWTWEHQSLTRARFICGTPEIQTAFDRIRTEILTAERDQTALADEIIEMREKMFPTHPPVDSNVKYARGGVVDVEFIVQYLILAHARQYPQLLDNYGNIALLNIAADCGLIDKTLAEQSRTAYRFYRQQQHNTKLRDAEKTEVTDELLAHYGNVRKLWREVFGEEAKLG